MEFNPSYLVKYVGGEYFYETFITFVKEQIAPYTEHPFVEEDYYEQLYNFFFKKHTSSIEIHRGGSKTEFGIWISIYIMIMKPINFKSGNQIKQMLIIGADGTTTTEIFKRIETYLFSNPYFKNFLPDSIKSKEQRNKRWNTSTMELKNNFQIHFRQVKCKRGLHVDWIWIDDVITENASLTDQQTKDAFKSAIIPMGEVKKANITITGTPLRFKDIYMELRKNPAFENLKLPVYNSKNEILAKKRFTLQQVEEIKKKIGSLSFNCEYLLNPVSDDTSIIKLQHINNSLQPKEYTYDDFDEIYCCIDFAFGDIKTSDYSVFMDIGIKRTETKIIKHIINIRYEKGLSVREHFNIMAMNHAKIKYKDIVAEENSIKGFTKDLEDFELPISLFHTGTKDEEDIKNKSKSLTDKNFYISKTYSKQNAIFRLATSLENNEWKIPYKSEKNKLQVNYLIEELVSWTMEEGKIEERGIHPDAPICMLLLMERLRKPKVSVIF